MTLDISPGQGSPAREAAAESGFLEMDGYAVGQAQRRSISPSSVPLTALLVGCLNVCMKIASLIIHPDGGSSQIVPSRETAVPPLGHMASCFRPCSGKWTIFPRQLPRSGSSLVLAGNYLAEASTLLHVLFVHMSDWHFKAQSRQIQGPRHGGFCPYSKGNST